jgi:hypothetical protein
MYEMERFMLFLYKNYQFFGVNSKGAEHDRI